MYIVWHWITIMLLFKLSLVVYMERGTRFCSRSVDSQSFCEYRVGDPGTKIIFGVPHGGTLKPEQMGSRDAGCWVDGKCIWSKTVG